MKHEWKKQEKSLYLPGASPQVVDVPGMVFWAIDGRGNPNDEPFSQAIGVLYSLSYALKMMPKKGPAPQGFHDYAIYPLEAVWSGGGQGEALDKDQLVYTVMIRQPDFLTKEIAEFILEQVKKKKPHPLLEQARRIVTEEGRCVQTLHLGSYDTEPASFAEMDAFCAREGLRRREKDFHREIYLTDARKTAPDKLKTVLRYPVELE